MGVGVGVGRHRLKGLAYAKVKANTLINYLAPCMMIMLASMILLMMIMMSEPRVEVVEMIFE